MKKLYLLFLSTILLGATHSAHALIITDPGFESYSVDPGGFTKEAGSWTLANDAGVVEPFSPNSSNGQLDTWSATFAAIEGEQYASTYAGLDSITQSINIPARGLYTFSIYAASPDGSVTIAPHANPFILSTGSFSFEFDGNQLGSFSIDPGTDWMEYSLTTELSAGIYTVGVINTARAPYFINYDNFTLSQVPVPAAVWLFASGLMALIYPWRLKYQGFRSTMAAK